MREAWAAVRPAVLETLETVSELMTEFDLIDLIATDRAQLWTNGDSFVVTEMRDFPRCRALGYLLAGGSLDRVVEMEPDIEAWARGYGCRYAHTIGRPGWARRPGFERRGEWMTKEI